MIANVQTVFLALLATASAGALRERQEVKGVAIANFQKNETANKGTGDVSAAGTLEPFGGIGVGCGINWEKDVSYGGGVQAGSSDYGLGGGFTISPKNITIGLGIGLNGDGTSANIDFTGQKDGGFELVFTSSKKVECKESQKDGKTVTTCGIAFTPVAPTTPAKNESATVVPTTPAKNETATVVPTTPAKNETATIDPITPAKNETATVNPTTPEKNGASSTPSNPDTSDSEDNSDSEDSSDSECDV